MPYTARDLITLALHDAGIFGTGTTPAGADINNALTRFNDMVAQWQRKRWLIPFLVDTGFNMTGAVSYTIGTGGNFNIPRPDRIEAAFVRQISQAVPYQVDTPVEILQSREAFSRVGQKQLVGFPGFLFYDPTYPLGALYPWPLGGATYSLHVLTKGILTGTMALATDLSTMPAEYMAALRWNIEKVFLAAYRMPEDPNVNREAKAGLDLIKASNFQLATMQMPEALIRSGTYNVLTDNST